MRELFDYCTTRQAEVLDAYITHGYSSRKAAADLGIGDRSVRQQIGAIKKKAAQAGWTEHFDARKFVDAGQEVSGKSTLTKDDDGNVVWIKTTRQRRDINLANQLSESIDTIKPWKLVAPPKKPDTELLSVYTITDYHIGAYSWGDETGNDWDLKIAEKVLKNALSDMILASPKSGKAIFCQLGDFLHWDGLIAITPTAKNILDADGRYEKLTTLAVNCCVSAIKALLRKHDEVHVIMAEGNHDVSGSVWLRMMMKKLFANNPRVTVEESPFPFYKYVFGDVFIGWHHGHLVRIKDLAGKFYSEFGKEMGGATHRRIHTGHTHQSEIVESAGVITERHPTLSGRDAYGARGFHKTLRAAQVITYHEKSGEVSRNVVYPRL